jgi:aminoglycoside/choline kinase family phosphotransferase
VSTPAPFAEPSDARARAHVAASLGEQAVVTPLSGDASDRRYFRVRIPAGGAAEARRRAPRSWVLAVHAAPFDPATLNTIDATRLFRAAGLPVPAIVEVDAARGVLRLEDLGDVRLQDALAGAPPARRLAWYREAVALIHGIHRATDLARSGGYQAGRLAFDVEKLGFEMGFFFTHYVEGLRGQSLPPPLAAAFRAELDGLVAWLAARPRVLAHRDYHARNLMVLSPADKRRPPLSGGHPGSAGPERGGAGGMRGASALKLGSALAPERPPADDARLVMVDHQDARLGPVTYDLASLVYDPYVELTPAEVSTCLEAFVDGAADRAAARAALAEELDRMALERLLKAVGTYGYQTQVRGTQVYLPYFVPALARAHSAARRAGGFPATVEAVALLMRG